MVHGDVHPANVLISAEPGGDDAYRYQQEADIDLDAWRAAVLWSHLDGALRYLTNAPSHVPHWGFPPGGRVFEMLAFYSSGEADGWPRLPGPGDPGLG